MDDLFFIGNQLVATSHTGKVGVWNAVTQHWQVGGRRVWLSLLINVLLLNSWANRLWSINHWIFVFYVPVLDSPSNVQYVCFSTKSRHEITLYWLWLLCMYMLGSRCGSYHQLWHSRILSATGLQQWLYLLHRYTHAYTHVQTHTCLLPNRMSGKMSESTWFGNRPAV